MRRGLFFTALFFVLLYVLSVPDYYTKKVSLHDNRDSVLVINTEYKTNCLKTVDNSFGIGVCEPEVVFYGYHQIKASLNDVRYRTPITSSYNTGSDELVELYENYPLRYRGAVRDF